MFLIFTSVHKNFVEKLKTVAKNCEKLNYSYGKVSHDLKTLSLKIELCLNCLNIKIIYKIEKET